MAIAVIEPDLVGAGFVVEGGDDSPASVIDDDRRESTIPIWLGCGHAARGVAAEQDLIVRADRHALGSRTLVVVDIEDPLDHHLHSGVRITQAHFHCGSVGVNGPIIVFLAGFRAEWWDVVGKWVSNATITDANVINPACGTTLVQIFNQARLGNVYVNVHSVAHPAGVARGQLAATGANWPL